MFFLANERTDRKGLWDVLSIYSVGKVLPERIGSFYKYVSAVVHRKPGESFKVGVEVK